MKTATSQNGITKISSPPLCAWKKCVGVSSLSKPIKPNSRPRPRITLTVLNLASYYYAAEKYREVLPLLTQVEYKDLRYSLGAKALLLRTYYDLEEYEALYSLTGSFRQFLLRNKLMADSRRTAYYNLFKFTQRAARIRALKGYHSSEKLKRELEKLTKDIQEAEAIFNKSWLEEKIGELEN